MSDMTSLQGNYDPKELIFANRKTVDTVKESANKMLKDLRPQRLIANLGEGLGSKESPMLAKTFIDAAESELMIRDS